MKIKLTMIYVIVTSLTLIHLVIAEVTLKIVPITKIIRVNQRINIGLEIIGSDVNNIVKTTEDVNLKEEKSGSFKYEFIFMPKRKGKYTFGPYTISFNNQILTSNTLYIEVLPEWDGSFGTFYRIDQDSISLGDQIEFVVETWSSQYLRNSLWPKQVTDYECSNTATESSTTIKKNVTYYYTKSIWTIKPKITGTFKINQDFFQTFPDGIKPPDFTITVK